MNDTQKQNYTFVLMGVSGSGKSAVATGVAQQLQAAFLDGDFLHPKSNILKMASGHALNDDDRKPWLVALNNAIFAMQRTNKVSLVVSSALKKSYRDILREGNHNLYFIYLKGDAVVIEERLKARKGHFFKPEMLKSQFDALQEPGADEPDVQVVDIRPSLENVIENTCSTIRKIVAGDN
ncbi:gluconokinase [Providencia huaxiensis]|uniref:Gluconokinase n=1 Tax=Providencia huaxiensis TaxID=2027290 RepID=A0ABU2ISZ3_9GAMM|nr:MULTISPECIES: gluconokinase [Providencia]AXH63013.1 gluconokinase [Providencia huaxiensis]MBN6360498.1 gluconokinase [Providencia huaxiensis]MBQ0535028.1 gluconokinase [Providencia huaxiensis]MBQ0589704.1 gluconokinase [Providencia huaxiensis]MBZ3683520.1 gluconokinase [Providencia rettgeri]